MSHEPLPQASKTALLRRFQALQHRTNRDRQRVFLLEGARHFIQAADLAWDLEAIVYAPILFPNNVVEMIVRRRRQQGTPTCKISPEEFRTLQCIGRASGIAAIAKQRWQKLAEVDPQRGLAWLVIEQLRSAGNLGTILRTAEATGVGGVIFVGNDADPHDPIAVRATMGGIFHLPLVRTTLAEFSAWLSSHQVSCLGLSPHGERLWTDSLPAGPICLAIGEERQGLSAGLTACCSTLLRLPLVGRADSLNVGIAAGAMLYELIRQRSP
jgi:TrmH family RNA methyltransferase